MAVPLPNAKGNPKSKTIVYYGDVCSMLKLISMTYNSVRYFVGLSYEDMDLPWNYVSAFEL